MLSERASPESRGYLADMIARAPARPRRVAMVWAYFDETVVHEQVDGKLIPTHLLIAGGASTLEKWKSLEGKWRQALSDEGVSCFHGSEFYHFRKEFEWYTPEGKNVQRQRFPVGASPTRQPLQPEAIGAGFSAP
jgi:hypothetical protein